VWLDDVPVAVFMPDPADPAGEPLTYFIHTDHLNTPRVVVDREGRQRWSWMAEPFGTTAPLANPSGLGDFTFNLRFPGQYADAESGLFYNWNRYYQTDGGSYTQSDPIGLASGSPSTYTYVDGNPLSSVDPTGLDVLVCFYPGGVTHVGFGNGNAGNDGSTSGFYPIRHRPWDDGIVKPDTEHTTKECLVLPAAPEQDSCMEQCQADRAQTPGRYKIIGRQCTSFARDCLRQCGLPAGTFGPTPEVWYRSLPGAAPPLGKIDQ
jgi:RHS repeat-associated protein